MTGKAYCILLICEHVCVKCACACVVSELVLFVRQTNVTYNIVPYRWFDSLLWRSVGFLACNSQLEQCKDYSRDVSNLYIWSIAEISNKSVVPVLFQNVDSARMKIPLCLVSSRKWKGKSRWTSCTWCFPRVSSLLRQFGRDWGPAFVQKCRRRLVGKVLNDRDNQDSKNHFWHFWFQCDSHLWATTRITWPSVAFNLVFGHARKAAESAQRSREAMQQMSACKCTWRFDAAFDCPRFILFPFVFGANRKSL